MSECWLLFALLVFPCAAFAQPVLSLEANSARDCAVCHLNWVDAFRQPRQGILLMDPPDRLVVSEGDTCLGCHDSSVADSRRRVWSAHNHVTGVKPPAGMTVPPQLPLKNGELACRTCHTAHTGQGPETLATTVFLRMRNDASQLCQTCHADKTKGPGLGTHPVGGMPWPTPPALLAAGAKQGPDPQRLICQTCHTPHGASQEHLLVMGTESSQLCLTCHTKLRPGLWRPEAPREHPQNPPLGPVQEQAIKDMGTHAGANDTLICLSCHKLHHGLAGRYMLADTLHDSRLCLHCHPGRSDMFNTKHDLRVSSPDTRNRLGQSPEESGPCGACHSFHQFARRPNPEPLDPSGLCATCHSPGQCAEKATGLPFSHPTDIQKAVQPGGLDLRFYPSVNNPAVNTVACLTCHNPHKVSTRHFLRADSATLCGTCHGEKVASMGEAHDFTDRPDLVNDRSETGAQAGKCGFCHTMHDAVGPKMWIATAQAPQKPNDWCVECHSPTGMARAAKMSPLRHPTGPDAVMMAPAGHATTTQTVSPGSLPLAKAPDSPPLTKAGASEGSLPLFDSRGRFSATGSVGCPTCHDPHSGGAGGVPQMLRLTSNPGDTALCAACHPQGSTIQATLHNPHTLGEHFSTAGFCAPCHAVHEISGMPPSGMWAAPPGSQGESPAVRRCTGCHSPGGGATPVAPPVHPAVPMANISQPGTPGWTPLYDANGNPGPTGSIACGTCHLPHGPLDAPGRPTGLTSAPAEELRGLRIMVRPYVAPNLCSSCHGFDGLIRYLYFHKPALRRTIGNEAP